MKHIAEGHNGGKRAVKTPAYETSQDDQVLNKLMVVNQWKQGPIERYYPWPNRISCCGFWLVPLAKPLHVESMKLVIPSRIVP